MKQFISRNRKWFGYIIYCILLTVALLYYRFPSDTLRDYLQARANNLDTPLFLSIDRIKPWLPFGLKFRQTEISFKEKPNIKIFSADSLLVKPQAWSFFKGKSKYCFECLSYGGDIRGCIYFEKDRLTAPFNTEIELNTIRVGNYEHLKDLIGTHVNGILSGTICYRGQHKNLIDGAGEANLKLLDGKVDLLLPILSLESIKFNEVKIDMVLKTQKINLTHFELEGPLLKSTMSGTISLKKEFAKSTLDLTGKIEPFAAFFKNTEGVSNTVKFFKQRLRKGTLVFIIQGTIGEPKIRFT